jgi:hypothetical protein
MGLSKRFLASRDRRRSVRAGPCRLAQERVKRSSPDPDSVRRCLDAMEAQVAQHMLEDFGEEAANRAKMLGAISLTKGDTARYLTWRGIAQAIRMLQGALRDRS